ncbi:MAG: methylamine methyltransferase corrinoid protein reductive activase [Candidatus Aegiribacteria sp.]|nr:methylamine methyltransferase corrinoid protein reductive activase [Candidatus Aegiribacteria sp.]
MSRLAIAMDIGTSGLRAQALDLSSRDIISTVITTRHPLPGANVIDHIHFALEIGLETANRIIIQAVNRIILELHINTEKVVRLAVCGNPIQLSLFQGIEIRDLAFAGKRKLESLGVVSPEREAVITATRNIPGLNLPAGCDVIIPPSVCHEIGADSLAMIIQTGMLEKDETSLATDYGTNAEMALLHQGRVFTGSTAAGPALEGQQISCGMLAVPGAVSDLNSDISCQRLIVLDSEMIPAEGPLVDMSDGSVIDAGSGVRPIGITGTGTLAIVLQAMESGLILLPCIRTMDSRLHLTGDIFFTEDDLMNAGKAIGSVRAGHITLCREAGIGLDDIRTAYMSGASGTYVDPVKAQKLGMVPPRVKTVFQVGNTSLSMARDLVFDLSKLDLMSSLADKLREHHCLFAASDTFKKVFILELSYWTEGMPISMYRKFLKKYGFPDLPPPGATPEIVHTVKRDIDDLGRMGLTIIPDIGGKVRATMEGCTACMNCVEECPENAITIIQEADSAAVTLDQSLCSGVACRRCERVCPHKCFDLSRFFCITSEELATPWE